MPNIMTAVARLSYPNLFKPKPFEQGSTPVFSCSLLFDKAAQETPEFQAMVEAAQATATEKWGAKIPKFRFDVFRDGNEVFEQKGEEAYKDCLYINCKNEQRPGVVDENVDDIIDPLVIYAGCKVRAQVSVYAYDYKGNCGVSFGLLNVQKVGDGKPLGASRPNPKDAFKPVATNAETASQPANKLFR